MKRLIRYLREHPLVWIMPLLVLVMFLGLVVYKIARTPTSPFIYDL